MIVGWVIQNGGIHHRIAVVADETGGYVELAYDDKDGGDGLLMVDSEDAVDDLVAALTKARDVLWPRVRVGK